MYYWLVFVLFRNRKKDRCQFPILAKISSFCQFLHPTPRRDAMKGNNNNLESWQFTTCWLEISDSAVSAEIKTLHVEFKTRFELWSWCTVPENSLLNFYTQIWLSIYTMYLYCTCYTSCYRCSNRCGFLLQTQCVGGERSQSSKGRGCCLLFFKDLSTRSSARFPQT